jgi:uncharacterized membrane protein
MRSIALVIAVTLSPISELRGGIPLGVLVFGLDPLLVFLVAIIANAVLFFPIFFGLRLFYDRFLSRFQLFNRYLENVRKRGKPKVDKYGFLGLTLFVAIPLPVTGVYTATFLSWLLAMDWKKAFPAIALGVVIAGVIVLLATLGVVGGWRLFTEIV